jgi:predicted DNA-binding protein
MATTKPRLHISLSKDEESFLASLAKRDQMPRATKAAQLVRQAMEIEEDFALSKIAMERDVPGASRMSAEAFWKAAFKRAKKA